MVPHSAGSQRRRRHQIRTDVLLAENTITEQDDLGAQQGLSGRLEVRHVERVAVIGKMTHEAARTGDPHNAHTVSGNASPLFGLRNANRGETTPSSSTRAAERGNHANRQEPRLGS